MKKSSTHLFGILLFILQSAQSLFGAIDDWKRALPYGHGTDWRYVKEAIYNNDEIEKTSAILPYRLTLKHHHEKSLSSPWNVSFRYASLMDRVASVTAIRFYLREDAYIGFTVTPVRVAAPSGRPNGPTDGVGLYELSLEISKDEMALLRQASNQFKDLKVCLEANGALTRIPFDYEKTIERALLTLEKVTPKWQDFVSHFPIVPFFKRGG